MRRLTASLAIITLFSVSLHACVGVLFGSQIKVMRHVACAGLTCADKEMPGAEGGCADHCLRVAEAVLTALIPSVSPDVQPVRTLIAIVPPAGYEFGMAAELSGRGSASISRRLLAGNAMLN